MLHAVFFLSAPRGKGIFLPRGQGILCFVQFRGGGKKMNGAGRAGSLDRGGGAGRLPALRPAPGSTYGPSPSPLLPPPFRLRRSYRMGGGRPPRSKSVPPLQSKGGGRWMHPPPPTVGGGTQLAGWRGGRQGGGREGGGKVGGGRGAATLFMPPVLLLLSSKEKEGRWQVVITGAPLPPKFIP
nr:hypothetical protein [Morchella crassipes]